jgi:hypothetical protein
MTAAVLLLGALLAQGHGAKAAGGGAGGAGKKTARAGEAARRPAPTTTAATPTTTSGGEGGGTSERAGGSDEGGKSAATEGAGGSGKTFKSKTYNFGAMDVEGKLKTPQLLYFLNRVKLELDMSAPDTRSFMKELEKSADDKNL